MVATSATTVVQTAIPTQKVTSTVAKSLQVTGQIPTSTGITQMQQIQRASPQIISMEALVQGARASNANKGTHGHQVINLNDSVSFLFQTILRSLRTNCHVP